MTDPSQHSSDPDLISGHNSADSIQGYRPRYLGCTPPKLERSGQNYLSPASKLLRAYENWVKFFPEGIVDLIYHNKQVEAVSKECVDDLSMSIEEINSALLSLESRTPRKIGFLLSALYQKLPERVIVWSIDFPFPMEGLGAFLRGKILVNRSICPGLGNYSYCPVVNYGMASSLGSSKTFPDGSGFVVNLNKMIGRYVLATYFLNFGEPAISDASYSSFDIRCKGRESSHSGLYYNDSHARAHSVSISEYLKNPGLVSYFEGLRDCFEAGRCDNKKVEEAIDSLGDEPGFKIELQVIKLLEWAR